MLALERDSSTEGWVELEVVQAVEGREVVLAGGGRAVRAASCLVVPEAGDEVVVVEAGGRRFVLGIATRAGGGPLRLESSGEMEITAAGRLGLASGGRVEVTAGGRFVLVAGGVELASRMVRAGVGVVRMGAGRIKLVAEELVSRLRRRFAEVEGVDRLEAGAIMQEASSVYCASGGSVAVEAEGDLRIDGQLVQLG